MTTEEIVDAARAAGFSSSEMFLRLPAFKHLIDSAAAAEREACAKLCESLFDMDDDSCSEAEQCAAAIRARSNK